MTKLRLIAAFFVLAALAGRSPPSSRCWTTRSRGRRPSRRRATSTATATQDLLVPDGLMINDGHGRFAKVAVGSVAFTRQNPRLVDLNGDGLADLISFIPTTGPAVAHLRIDLNVGMTFVLGSLLMSSAPPSPTRVAAFAVGDVDGDGDQDILAGTWNGASAATAPVLWLNDGFATFTQSPASVPASPMSPSVVLLGDLDADGDLDAVFAVSSAAPLLPPADVQVALNAGGVFFLVPTPILTGSVDSIVVARANNDALPDIVFVASGSAIVARELSLRFPGAGRDLSSGHPADDQRPGRRERRRDRRGPAVDADPTQPRAPADHRRRATRRPPAVLDRPQAPALHRAPDGRARSRWGRRPGRHRVDRSRIDRAHERRRRKPRQDRRPSRQRGDHEQSERRRPRRRRRRRRPGPRCRQQRRVRNPCGRIQRR